MQVKVSFGRLVAGEKNSLNPHVYSAYQIPMHENNSLKLPQMSNTGVEKMRVRVKNVGIQIITFL